MTNPLVGTDSGSSSAPRSIADPGRFGQHDRITRVAPISRAWPSLEFQSADDGSWHISEQWRAPNPPILNRTMCNPMRRRHRSGRSTPADRRRGQIRPAGAERLRGSRALAVRPAARPVLRCLRQSTGRSGAAHPERLADATEATGASSCPSFCREVRPLRRDAGVPVPATSDAPRLGSPPSGDVADRGVQRWLGVHRIRGQDQLADLASSGGRRGHRPRRRQLADEESMIQIPGPGNVRRGHHHEHAAAREIQSSPRQILVVARANPPLVYAVKLAVPDFGMYGGSRYTRSPDSASEIKST